MNGEWLVSFHGSCGFTTNINAELHVIGKELQLAWDFGYREVVCESDSLIALQLMIQEGTINTHPHAALIDYIRTFKFSNWNLSFTHTLREGNACTDWLAKSGASSNDSFKLLNSCPPPLALVPLADAMGVVRIRV